MNSSRIFPLEFSVSKVLISSRRFVEGFTVMKSTVARRFYALACITALLLAQAAFVYPILAQSRRVPPPPTNQKRNQRPAQSDAQQGGEQQEAIPPDVIGRPQDAETISVTAALVNVDTVVYHK